MKFIFKDLINVSSIILYLYPHYLSACLFIIIYYQRNTRIYQCAFYHLVSLSPLLECMPIYNNLLLTRIYLCIFYHLVSLSPLLECMAIYNNLLPEEYKDLSMCILSSCIFIPHYLRTCLFIIIYYQRNTRIYQCAFYHLVSLFPIT